MLINLIQAIAKLKAGEVVAIPTETVYGLAADACNESALRQIYAVKQRPADNPLIVHIGDISQVLDWAAEFFTAGANISQGFLARPIYLGFACVK